MDSSTPCKFFQSSRGCLRGDSCTFRHEKSDGNGQDAGTYLSASAAPPWQSSSHEPTASSVADLAHSITSYSSHNPYANGMGGTSAPCRFFLSEAGCRYGGSCTFAHVGAPPVSAYAPSPYGGMDISGGSGSGMMYAMMPPPPLPLQNMDGSMAMMNLGMDASTTPTNPGDASTTPSGLDAAGKPRRKLQIQANPSKTANYEVISEIMPVLTRDIEGPFFAIDVECVATGTGIDDRDVARIAIVDENEVVAFDRYVLPHKPIISYLTQLTGISESDLIGAPSLPEALVELRQILPRDSVIVGQSIKKDLEWLGLEKDADYKQAFDVADLFRIPMQSKNGTIRYRGFSLRHVAKHLLGHNIQEADHDPVIDAKYAMKIFCQFRHLHESPGRRDAVYQTLLQTPRTPSFAERYPEIDGVLMRVPRKPREIHPHHHSQQQHHHQQHQHQSHHQHYPQQHYQPYQHREHDHSSSSSGSYADQRDQYAYNALPLPATHAPDPALMT